MNQQPFIIIIGYAYRLNNALEEAIYDLLRSQNRRVIAAKDLPDYQEQLLGQIRELNAEDTHLPPVTAWFHNPGVPCLPDDCVLGFRVNDENTMLVSFTIYTTSKPETNAVPSQTL